MEIDENIDIESIAEKVHKAYCDLRIEQGKEEYWTKGDYLKLSEETKEYDRRTIKAVLKAISQNPKILKLVRVK